MNEHICQNCGCVQTVDEYDEDPQFVADNIDASDFGERYEVTVEIGVERNGKFVCDACGHTVDFDSEVVPTELSYRQVWEEDIPYYMVERRAVAEAEANYYEEDFL